MLQEERTAERVARNDSIFREANEGIRQVAEEHGLDRQVPFVCECADESCTEIIRLELAEYERIRSSAIRFLNAPGHHKSAGPYAAVVERCDGYDVVEKQGRSAALVTESDPRS